MCRFNRAERCWETFSRVADVSVLAVRVDTAVDMDNLREMRTGSASRMGTGVIVLGAVFDAKPESGCRCYSGSGGARRASGNWSSPSRVRSVAWRGWQTASRSGRWT